MCDGGLNRNQGQQKKEEKVDLWTKDGVNQSSRQAVHERRLVYPLYLPAKR